MSWHGIEAVEEAVDDTKQLLLPFDLGTWLRLALIVVLTGGLTGFVNPLNFTPSVSDGGHDSYSQTAPTTASTGAGTALEAVDNNGNTITGLFVASSSAGISNGVWLAVGLFILGVLTLLFYISSVFEFIYFQSLIEKDVRIRRNFKKNWFNGLQYFGFQLLYILGVVALVAAVILGFFVNPFLGIFGVLAGLVAMLLLAVFAGLVHDFVLPQMIQDDEGIVSAWRSIWPNMKKQWREVVVYLFVKLGLGIIIGIIVATVMLMLLVPFILVFGILAFLFAAAAGPLALIPVLAGILLFVVLMLGLTIVTRTFVYFYILNVYQRIFS